MSFAGPKNIQPDFAYTYRDYLIMPTPHDDLDSRQISTATTLCAGIKLNIPIVGANMGHLGGRMAEKLAQLGGIGILSQDFSIEEILKRIRRVKNANPYFHMPIVLSPENRVAEALALMHKRHFDCVILVDENSAPIGLATRKSLAKFPGWEHLQNVMKKELWIVPDSISTEDASRIMIDNQIHHLPVVDGSKKLVGCLTPLDITLRTHNYRPALDSNGRLLIGVAMGMKPKSGIEPIELARTYIQEEVDLLVLDVANGYLKVFVDFVAEVRREIGPDISIIAGNVADYEGAMRLLEAGCDSVKVGIGPGGACTTRRETGVGVPQATAVTEALRASTQFSKEHPDTSLRCILADGGIRNSFDLSVAVLLGAPAVMVGSILAGTYESSFETEIIDGEMWKRWRGNASSSAATYRRQKIYNEKYITEELEHSEGADGLVRVTESVAHKIFQLVEGLKQHMAQSNSADIDAFQNQRSQLLRLRHKPVPADISRLKFQDLYIVPSPSEVSSRKLVKLDSPLTSTLNMNIPFVALPAPFIQKKICTIMAQLGGIGFLSHKRGNENVARIAQRIHKIKQQHPYYFLPSIQESNEEIGKTIDFLNENAFSCVIIVKNFNNDWTPIGIATRDDLHDRPRTDPLYEVLKTNIYKVNEDIDLQQASELMLQKGIHHLPVINTKGRLVGCITPRDMTLRVLYGLKPNIGEDGKLRVGVSLRVSPESCSQILEEAMVLDQAGADILLIETDNGYARSYMELLEQLRGRVGCPIVAAGIDTYQGARAAFDAGADVVKVGTYSPRVALPEAIYDCSRAARECGKTIISEDVGIAAPRDANLSLIMGVQAVGLRQVLAATYENSMQIPMRRQHATTQASKLTKKKIGSQEYIMEDLSGASRDWQPDLEIKGSVINAMIRFVNGLRSSCTYSNAASLVEYREKATVGVQSPSGYQEGNPHAFVEDR